MKPGMTLAELGAWLGGMVKTAADVQAAPPEALPQYVISPMSVGARIAMRAASMALAAGEPRIGVEVRLSAVSLALCEQQLRDAARLVEYITQSVASPPSGSAGPTGESTPTLAHDRAPSWAGSGALTHGSESNASTTAALRWRRAIGAILHERQRQRGWRLGPGFFEARRAARLRYTELWKRSQGKPWLAELGAAEADELHQMERDQLVVEDLLQFRAIARVQLLAEQEAHSSRTTQATATDKPRKTWWEWATGNSAVDGSELPASLDAAGDFKLSGEQREKLAALLSGGAEAATALPTASSEYVEHRMVWNARALTSSMCPEAREHNARAPHA